MNNKYKQYLNKVLKRKDSGREQKVLEVGENTVILGSCFVNSNDYTIMLFAEFEETFILPKVKFQPEINENYVYVEACIG